MPSDDRAPTDEPADERANQSGRRQVPGADLTRRSVLRRSATGLAASSLGVAASTQPSLGQSESGPAPPENVRFDWRADGSVGVRWDWSGPTCDSSLSHFEVHVSSKERSQTHSIAPERRSAAASTLGPDTNAITVIAVGPDGQTASSEELTVDQTRVSDFTVVRPTASPSLAANESAAVPIDVTRWQALDATAVRYEVEVAIRPPCVATIQAVDVPEDDGLEFEDAQVSEDGTSAYLVGNVVGTPDGPTIAVATVAGRGAGAATLDVEQAIIEYREDDAGDGASGVNATDAGSTTTSSAATEPIPEPTVQVRATGQWTSVNVEGAGGPPIPTDVRREWQVSQTAGITWDWPGDPCDAEDGAHFRVTVRNEDGESAFSVPVGAPTAEVYLGGSEPVEVGVSAVDADGRESAAAWTRFDPVIVDPAYTLGPEDPSPIEPDGSTVVPVHLHQILGQGSGLLEYELSASVRTPCVATIEDVTLPADSGFEVVERSVASDGSTARIVAEGSTGDIGSLEVAQVHVAGEAPGATTLTVSDEQLTVVDGVEFDRYQRYRRNPDLLGDDASLDDLTRATGATDVPTRVTVSTGPPAIVGDAVPTDPDGDRLYEDVDGDGALGHADVQAFFSVQHRPSAKRPAYFDFNGNDAVGHGDVVELFEEVASRSLEGS